MEFFGAWKRCRQIRAKKSFHPDLLFLLYPQIRLVEFYIGLVDTVVYQQLELKTNFEQKLTCEKNKLNNTERKKATEGFLSLLLHQCATTSMCKMYVINYSTSKLNMTKIGLSFSIFENYWRLINIEAQKDS